MSENELVETKEDVDALFFDTHGVGATPEEVKDDIVINALNKTVATPDEKQFVRHMIAGDSQTEAYMKVFNKDGSKTRNNASVLASKLVRRKRVANYYVELLEKRESLAEESLPKLIDELNEDRELARALGQPASAIQAVKAKANLLGLENKPDNVTLNMNLVSDEAKEQLLRRMSKLVKRNQDIIDADFVELD